MIYSVFNTNELFCSVVGAGHARDKLTTIAKGPIIRGQARSYTIKPAKVSPTLAKAPRPASTKTLPLSPIR